MTKDKRNNLIITLTILVVLISVGSTFLIMKFDEPPKRESGHELVFAADSGQHELLGIDKFINLRKYTVFSLGSDSIHNVMLLEKARQKLNLIKENRDTINGVHIIIGNKTSYSFFIKAVDICSEKEPRAFAPHDNDIYAWYIDRRK